MIRLDCTQGTIEWVEARLGKPTCSNFHKILTPKTAKRSGQFVEYAYSLIAEELTQEQHNSESSGFMERGQVLEQRAVDYYEMQTGLDTEKVGFVLRDDRSVGGSPDRFVGKDGGLEIKCPAAHTHIGYLLDDEGIGYKSQVQGLLWLTERDWWDTLSFHPTMPAALVRQYRDEDFIAKLAQEVTHFLAFRDECKEKLQKLGLFSGQEFPSIFAQNFGVHQGAA